MTARPLPRTITKEEWTREVRSLLRKLAEIHEEAPLPANSSAISSRWTFPSAVLYVLTIITTCGYDSVAVYSDAGRLFTVVFGLVGIPIAFITAADVGKFCTACVIFIYRGAKRIIHRARTCICAWIVSRRMRSRAHHAAQQPSRSRVVSTTCSAADAGPMIDHKTAATYLNDYEVDQMTLDDDEENNKDKENNDNESSEDDGSDSLWFAISAYIVLICGYCLLGSLLYYYYEGWPVIYSFHFSFNTITTVGLGRVEVPESDWVYLALTVAYIIVGLAVVTSCIDLARASLSACFTKIHYYGRPQQHVDEMFERMRKMLEKARERKGGGPITWDELSRMVKKAAQRPGKPFSPEMLMHASYPVEYPWIDEHIGSTFSLPVAYRFPYAMSTTSEECEDELTDSTLVPYCNHGVWV